MDDRLLFDLFHEALDPGPRPGGFDRMRANLISKRAAAPPRRAFHMRFREMGYRVVAALAAAAIVIAVAAAIVASHHTTTSIVNAGPDPNTKAYRTLMLNDYNAMVASASDSCNYLEDTTCPAAVAKVVPTLQKWESDLDAFTTPPQLVVLDGQLRLHLASAAAELNAQVAFQKSKDSTGFLVANAAAVYEFGWITATSTALEGRYVAPSFQMAVSTVKQAVAACVHANASPSDFGCQRLVTSSACPSATEIQCVNDANTAEMQLQEFLISLTLSTPSSPAAHQLERDIADGDTALLEITDGLLHHDASKVLQGRADFIHAISRANANPVN